MPILSTKDLNREHGRLTFDEDEGWILNKTTGDSNQFISAAGVYACKMYLPRIHVGDTTPSMDVGRPG